MYEMLSTRTLGSCTCHYKVISYQYFIHFCLMHISFANGSLLVLKLFVKFAQDVYDENSREQHMLLQSF